MDTHPDARTPSWRRAAFLAAATAALAAVLASAAVPRGAAAESCSTNAALGRPTQASSIQRGYPAADAVDDSGSTRWASEWVDDAWIEVDLGSVLDLCRVQLDWEAAYGRSFRIEASDDGTAWRTLRTVTDGTGGKQSLDVDGSGRYVRLVGTERGTSWGYSLWELRVRREHAGERRAVEAR